MRKNTDQDVRSGALLRRLLHRNISVSQMITFALANFVGIAIVICGVRFYNDVRGTFDDEDSFVNKDYLIVSKQISTMNSLGLGGKTSFDDDELARIDRQPWSRRVGRFTPASFGVEASIDMDGRGMSTHLFLESIPDQFLDIAPEAWSWNEGAPEIPVIISKDYLALYNFGFAPTHGLPQVSESLMSSIPLVLTFSGNGYRETMPARIVGFSSRLNTIAVPDTFMRWANARYSTASATPSRVIIEVSNPGDPAVETYMQRHNYTIAGTGGDSGKASYLLNIITGIVVGIGGVITLLSFAILTLSISLLLHKNKPMMHRLMGLGYTPGRVAGPYCIMVVAVNGVVYLLAAVTVHFAATWWNVRLTALTDVTAPAWPAYVLGAVLTVLVTVANVVTVLRTTCRAFRY